MNVGVVGNPRYAGLAAILPGMAARAESLGMTFYSEPPLEPYWPHHPPPIGSAPLDSLSVLAPPGQYGADVERVVAVLCLLERALARSTAPGAIDRKPVHQRAVPAARERHGTTHRERVVDA